MRKHKYLDEIKVADRLDKIKPINKRVKRKWEEQRKIYGFDERETYSLDFAFYCWLYERLRMYFEKADPVVDLDYHKLDFKGEEFTLKELIFMLLDRLELYFKKERKCTEYTPEEAQKVREIGEIWAIILPYAWW